VREILKKLFLCAAIAVAAHPAGSDGLDVGRSRLTIHVYKSGLFSAFADNHVIEARLEDGSLQTVEPLAVSILVRAASLRVLDPDLAPDKRDEVQARMVGPEVLDAASYPEIRFASTSARAIGSDRWTVTGNLTIHGRTRPITADAARAGGLIRGSVRIKQRDFGITPISIVGGTVKVKDEILIEFEIAALP